MAKQMAKTMDFDIICDVMVKEGWSVVEVNYGPGKEWIDVMAWYDTTCEGDYKEHNGKWLIKNPKDAVIFKLRWA